jgi:hypothetical protein
MIKERQYSPVRIRFSLWTLFVWMTVAAVILAFAIYCGEAIGGIFVLWMMHVAVALILTMPLIYLGRKRANWQTYDLLAFVLPFLVWGFCMVIDGKGKTLSNGIESIFLSAAVPFGAIVRIAIGRHRHRLFYSLLITFGLCLVGIVIYWSTPGLPE